MQLETQFWDLQMQIVLKKTSISIIEETDKKLQTINVNSKAKIAD